MSQLWHNRDMGWRYVQLPFGQSTKGERLVGGTNCTPWLYLKGISTSDFGEALQAIAGDGAKGLSPNVIVRLKGKRSQNAYLWPSHSRKVNQVLLACQGNGS